MVITDEGRESHRFSFRKKTQIFAFGEKKNKGDVNARISIILFSIKYFTIHTDKLC